MSFRRGFSCSIASSARSICTPRSGCEPRRGALPTGALAGPRRRSRRRTRHGPRGSRRARRRLRCSQVAVRVRACSASSSRGGASNASETYFRKTRPRTRCLYTADSTLPRSLLAASKRAAPLGFSPFPWFVIALVASSLMRDGLDVARWCASSALMSRPVRARNESPFVQPSPTGAHADLTPHQRDNAPVSMSTCPTRLSPSHSGCVSGDAHAGLTELSVIARPAMPSQHLRERNGRAALIRLVASRTVRRRTPPGIDMDNGEVVAALQVSRASLLGRHGLTIDGVYAAYRQQPASIRDRAPPTTGTQDQRVHVHQAQALARTPGERRPGMEAPLASPDAPCSLFQGVRGESGSR